MTKLIPPGSSERWVEHESGMLRVLHAGSTGSDRLPLVLIHGGGSDNAAISWYRLMEPLSIDRAVWAIDLPGFGGSIEEAPVGGPEALADVVAQAMGSLEIGLAVAVGVSMGGDTVLNLALRHPHLVAGLVPIAPGGLMPVLRNRMVHFGAWFLAQAPDGILLPVTRLSNRAIRTVLRGMVRDPAAIPREVFDEFAREARDPRSAVAYLRYNQATLGAAAMLNDLTPRLDEIGVPTLLFHGDRDPIVPLAGSRAAAERIPGARLVIAPDCGHWAQLEQHDLFLTEVTEFFAQVG